MEIFISMAKRKHIALEEQKYSNHVFQNTRTCYVIQNKIKLWMIKLFEPEKEIDQKYVILLSDQKIVGNQI